MSWSSGSSSRLGCRNGSGTPRSSCLVEVVTDEGLIGWGECFAQAEANRALIESVYAPLLIGRDAGEHIALWEGDVQPESRVGTQGRLNRRDLRGGNRAVGHRG